MTVLQFPEPDQEERIRRLRAELEKLGGIIKPPPVEMSADMEEEFLRHVIEYETREPMSLLIWLEKSGVEVPA